MVPYCMRSKQSVHCDPSSLLYVRFTAGRGFVDALCAGTVLSSVVTSHGGPEVIRGARKRSPLYSGALAPVAAELPRAEDH